MPNRRNKWGYTEKHLQTFMDFAFKPDGTTGSWKSGKFKLRTGSRQFARS